MMSTKATKRPLRSLTAHEKLDAIRRVHDGESKASVARDIGVPESTLRGWCKNEDKISYLSRQSSPETDESLEHSTQVKKAKLDDSSMQPFNLSLKISGGGAYSPNGALDYTKTDADSSKNSVHPISKSETPKSTQMSERERNRAELARLSVELGLNRPEMFLPGLSNASANLADLSANVGLLTQWNSLLVQQQQQQIPHSTNKSASGKVTAPADTSGTVSSSGGLLTIVDQDKNKLPLPSEKQSVHESVWYWLKTQQAVMNLNQAQTTMSNPPVSNGVSTPTTAANNTTNPSLNGMTPDQSSWFWKWYKQFAYGQHQLQVPVQDVVKPILYQQLTKDVPKNDSSLLFSDQQNAENLSMHEERHKSEERLANNKVRSVLDNLLFNNNNNVTPSKKEDELEEDCLSQGEAVEHGEKFLKWLESCSDPSVTAMQIMQFRTLLNNVKMGADRRNGDIQNKAKVKRK